MSVVGIDYGNMDCVIAQAKRGGIDIVLNENSNRKNPNLVCFQGKQRLIGESGVSVARMHFRNAATNIKRMLGRKFNDPEIQREIQQVPFKCVELPDGTVGVVLTYNEEQVTLRCEQVAAMVLNKLQQVAAMSNDNINVAFSVVSVPCYYTDIQRRALLNACKIAGLNCLRLLNEYTATALAYGIYKSARKLFDESEPQYTMFIDLGHSSYTVSIVAFVQGKLQVKSVAFDRELGGRDFDLVVAKYVNELFMEKTKCNALEKPKSRMKLLAACEKAKKTLSPQGVSMASISIECLYEDHDFNTKLELDKFEELIAPLLARLEAPIQNALKDSGIDKSLIENIEIVGGGSRVASVKRTFADILGLDKSKPNMGLSTTMNADESVARGCALDCAILSPLFKVKEFQVVDSVLFPVRVSWDETNGTISDMDTNDEGGEVCEVDASGSDSLVIFEKMDGFPKTKRITLRRSKEFELRASYDDQAKDSLPENYNTNLSKFTISGIPEATDGDDEVPRIRINVRVDGNGIFGIDSSHLMQPIKEQPKEEVEATTEGEKMDTDAKTPEAAADKPVEAPKKRFRKIDLRVNEVCEGGMSLTDIQSAVEAELNMFQQDRIIEETSNRRNDLESYIYDIRGQLDGKLKDFINEEDRTNFNNKLQELEDWLYSDEGFDSTKSIYIAKLGEATTLGEPIQFRFRENTDRPAAASRLLSLTEDYKRIANSTDAKYEHWTDDDRATIRKACSDGEFWLTEQLGAQNNLKPDQVPVLLSSAINAQIVSVRNACTPVLNKPVPAPPAPVVPEESAAPAADGEKAEESATGVNKDMELD